MPLKAQGLAKASTCQLITVDEHDDDDVVRLRHLR